MTKANDSQLEENASLSPLILFGMLVFVVLGNFLWKISASLYAPFDLVSKLFPIIAIVLLLGFSKLRINLYWWAAIFFYLLYLVYGVAISLHNSKSIKIILVQMYHELKFFPVVAIFSLCVGAPRWVDISRRAVVLITFASFFLVIFQFGASGVYNSVFSAGGHINIGYVGGMQLPRAAGTFWHASYLASFCTIGFVFFVALLKKNIIENFALILIFLTIIIVATVQRFEWLLHFIAVAILLLRRYTEINIKPYLAFVFLAMTCGFFFYVISDSSNYYAIYENFHNERTDFLFEAFWELERSNYLGGGWGTIGSHTAKDIADVYQYNDMKDLWWVKENRAYFYDTYWPHIIGETGVPGFLLLIFSMTMILRGLYSLESVLLMFVFFLTSLFSSSTQDLLFLVLFGWFIFVLENLERSHGRGGSQLNLGEKV